MQISTRSGATCFCFERLLQDDEATNAEVFDAENYPTNLGFNDLAWHSSLFRNMSDEPFSEVASPLGRLAFNNHGLGLSLDVFTNNTLLNQRMPVNLKVNQK